MSQFHRFSQKQTFESETCHTSKGFKEWEFPFWSLSHTFVGHLDTSMLVCQTFKGFLKFQSVCHSCKGFWWFLLCHTFKGFFSNCDSQLSTFESVTLWNPVKPTFFGRFSDKETILPIFVLKPSFLNPQVKLWHVTVSCHSFGGFGASLIKLWHACHGLITLSKNKTNRSKCD